MVSLAYEILKKEVKKAGSVGAVAKKLNYARSTVSLYVNDKYTASVEEIEKKILAVFSDKILCPFTDTIISKEECDEACCSKINASNPVMFKWQQFCKNCPVKFNKKEQFKKRFKGEK